MNKFVHLHVHTHYSLLDGLTKIDELIEAAQKEGSPAVAMTDHGVMYGIIEFYQKCTKAGIKPILGMEGYMAPKSRFDKVTRTDGRLNYHLLLLAKNNIGYQNLIKITSIAHLEGFYYKPRFDWETLEKHHEGLIACSACLGGELPTLIRSGQMEKAKERAKEFNVLFGQGNYYLELMHHPNLETQMLVNKGLIEIGKELNIPLVATNDVHYLNKEDAEAQDILLCLQNKKKREDTDRMNMTDGDYSFRTTKKMIKDFSYIPEAIENTVRIAEKCNVNIELGNVQLPFFEVEEGYDEDGYLRKLCEDGLVMRFGKKYGEVSEEIKKRMDYELSVIKGMGWPSYFLIVADFVTWAKNQDIVVGPGRGSAAGSLVCYLTGITNIDPLHYELLFERFLNPDRISMPDIDLDFADIRRAEVIKYVEDKYGKDRVSQIITFGTMAARAAVRDVGRVLGAPYDYCDKLAKAIPMFTKIDEALENVAEFKEFYKEDSAKQIIDYARRLEGVSRHASTHACGVLITKKKLTEYTPIQYASSADKSIVSQYSLHPTEDLGLLKMDFLGLKNLTIIESAIKIIKEIRGVEIKMDDIPLDDKKTFKLFQDAETTGVFQFESSGMKRYLKELKPSDFEDVIAMVALYRPGPMEWIPDYIAGKHGRAITYLHPKLEPILKKTYGVAIYQEQVMQMARALAGFTMAEADVLRKAVGKKIIKLLEQQKEKFIEGCVKNGINSELAKKIFSFIEPFAGYGFNRSHAACYALVGYQTAYLKAHFPTEFMAALLTADRQHIDRLSVEIEECQRMGIDVTRPDINESYELFTVVPADDAQLKARNGKLKENKDAIRFGLNAVKNMGANISKVLIDEREAHGPYKDISDLLERVIDRDLNKKSLESLIKTGALDDFGERGTLLKNIELMLTYNKERAKNANNGQTSLFADAPNAGLSTGIRLEPYPKVDKQEMLAWEKELLGLYVSAHPFSDFREHVKEFIEPLKKLDINQKDKTVTIGGIITQIQKIITRTNKSMLFVKIEDETANIEVLVFPNLLKNTYEIWQAGKAIIVQGKISDKDQDIKLLANTAFKMSLRNIREIKQKFLQADMSGSPKSFNKHSESIGPLHLVFSASTSADQLEQIKEILLKYKGNDKVYFEMGVNGDKKIIETDFQVRNTSFLLTELMNRLSGVIRIKR